MKIHEADEDGDVLAFLTGQVIGLLFDFTIPISQEVFAPTLISKMMSFLRPLGRSGESGVTSAGAGQDFVKTWHEEAPENFAHVLWAALPRPDEGL